MKNPLKIYIVMFLMLAASMLRAQDVSNLYMAGGSYSAGATPAFAGTGLYAHQINTSGTYAFTMIDALPANTKPFTVSTNIGAGIAQRVATIDGVSIFIPTSAGISYTGNNVGWAWTTGIGAPFKVRSSANGGSWYLMPTARILKSSVSGGSGYQSIVGLLFGWVK